METAVFTNGMKSTNVSHFERALKPLLTFGKLIGVVPISHKRLRWNNVIIVILILNVSVDVVGTCRGASRWRSPLDVASSVGSVAFYSNGLFIYYYMNRNMDGLYGILKEWKQCDSLSPVKDTSLFCHVNFWAALVFTSAILENVVFHFKLCAPVLSGTVDPPLWCLFYAFGGNWPLFFQPSNFLGVYVVVTNKMALYAWNFMDVLIMVLSRGIYFQFETIASIERRGSSWLTLRAEFTQALKLLKVTEDFLSPMVFASYGINTYALCMQLNLWLTPSRNRNMLDSTYSVWSSLHLVFRVLLVTISAANINSAVGKVIEQTRNCPNQAYNMDLYRLEEMVISTPVGLTGLRCFLVTKKFLLTLISVVFTFEVVLLQSYAAIHHPSV